MGWLNFLLTIFSRAFNENFTGIFALYQPAVKKSTSREMKKWTMCLGLYLLFGLFPVATYVSADENTNLDPQKRLEQHINQLYALIDFRNSELLPYDVFNKAYKGYLNLRHEGKLNVGKEILTICDMALPSSFTRMWIIDLAKRTVLFNTYVAHGQGSGNDCHLTFSNRSSTHKSSLGFYVTTDTYEGEHGTSLHLDGLDHGFNDAALKRGIVVHGAEYVNADFVQTKDRLGRSWGCPAVPSELSLPIINTIKEGTCLFIYYPDKKYLQKGYWLNKHVSLPAEYGEVSGTRLPLTKGS